MKENSNISFLEMVLIGWKITFVAGCFFLIYSLYDGKLSAIIFCVLFLLFNWFLIKKYTREKRKNENL
jgi:positive regulator of sigma E activity